MLDKEFNVEIIDVDNKGNGIAKIDNIVVFIKGALKNEIVKIKINNVKKRYMTAEIIEIIKPSNLRINVLCPYYKKCGGCKFMHTSLDNEIDIKKEFINNLFKEYKINYIDFNYEYNYRNKVTLHIKNGKLGLYKDKTNDLVEINYCYLLDNKINDVIKELNKYDLSNIYEIVIRSTYFTREIMINIKGKLNDNDLNNIKNINNLKSLYINNKLVYGNSYIIEIINNIKYSIYPDAFFQINTRGMILLYDKIKDYAGSSNSLLDLYCGTGTIGIYLNDNFSKITGIEINNDSIENANINKKLNNISNINFICNDSSYNAKGYDVLVVDPPRNGLSKKVISNINNNKYPKVIYVSCNPLTLKRDLKFLEDKYVVKEISLLNMFVKTQHVETICMLELK